MISSASEDLGELTLVAEDRALTGLYFDEHRYRPAQEALGARVEAGRTASSAPRRTS